MTVINTQIVSLLFAETAAVAVRSRLQCICCNQQWRLYSNSHHATRRDEMVCSQVGRRKLNRRQSAGFLNNHRSLTLRVMTRYCERCSDKCSSAKIMPIMGDHWPLTWSTGHSMSASHDVSGLLSLVALSFCRSIRPSVMTVYFGKQLTGPRSAVCGGRSGWPKKLYIRWGPDPHRNGQMLGKIGGATRAKPMNRYSCLLKWWVECMDPRNVVWCGRAHWRHLANTVERLCATAIYEWVCMQDGCSQITLFSTMYSNLSYMPCMVTGAAHACWRYS